MAGKTKTQTKKSLPSSIVLGVGIGIVTCILLCIATALLLSNGTIKEERQAVIVPAILFLSAGIGSSVSARNAGEQIAVVCVATGGIWALLMMGITLFFFDGVFNSLLIKLLSILLGCILSCIFCAKKKKKRPSR